VLALLGSGAFSELLAALPGYAPDRPGEVATIPDLLSWTEFREVT